MRNQARALQRLLTILGSCGLHKGTNLHHTCAPEARKVPSEAAALDDTARLGRDHVAEKFWHALNCAGRHRSKKSASSPKTHNNNWRVPTAVPKNTAGGHTRRGPNVTSGIIRHRPWKQLGRSRIESYCRPKMLQPPNCNGNLVARARKLL